jgi:hypothetical protein
MGAFETKAAAVIGPIAEASATGRRGVYRESYSTTAVSRVVPSGWKGNFVDFQANGADFQVAFSIGAAATLVFDQVEAFNSVTGDAAVGWEIKDGTRVSWIVPSHPTKDVYVNFICAGGTSAGFLEAYLSETNSQVK